MRWLFVAGLATAVLGGAYAFDASFPVPQATAIGTAILAYNTLFLLYHRFRPARPVPLLGASRIEAGLQIGLDLLALTALVHFSGGAESPFIILYVIHAIAGSMLLPRRLAWLVGAVAFVLLLLVVVLEYEPLLLIYRSQSLDDVTRLRQRSIRIAVAIAFLVAMATAVSITSSIMSGLRLRERQLLRVQEALIKKSEDLERTCVRLTENQVQLIRTEKQASLGRLVAGIYPFFRKQMPVLLQDMADGAGRIGAIVSDLKTFAHQDDGALDEEVDLIETVRSAVRLLHNQLKHFRVKEELDPHLPRIRGNRTQLQQVVVNVLQNASQALGSKPDG